MLKFARLDPKAVAPSRKHPSDAGVDVFALQDYLIWPFSFKVLRTGVTFEIPADTFLLVKPKGRNNHLTGSGVIDAGYQGEILIKVVNYSWKPLRIPAGSAIAQLVHLPVICDPLQEVPGAEIHVTASQRAGSGGIHQTG
jgi:dUTP pyrophosphatase